MPNYAHSVIYKLVCLQPEVEDMYIGSTTNATARAYNHRNHCTRPTDRSYSYPVYTFIREHGGWANWSMAIIEQYPCATKVELETRERYHVEQLHPSLNVSIPTRPHSEWRTEHKEQLAAYSRQYHEANKEAIAERHRRYREVNREALNQRQKAWSVRQVICPCGASIAAGSQSKHIKSKRHVDRMG
jgi:hypothetical protein